MVFYCVNKWGKDWCNSVVARVRFTDNKCIDAQICTNSQLKLIKKAFSKVVFAFILLVINYWYVKVCIATGYLQFVRITWLVVGQCTRNVNLHTRHNVFPLLPLMWGTKHEPVYSVVFCFHFQIGYGKHKQRMTGSKSHCFKLNT